MINVQDYFHLTLDSSVVFISYLLMIKQALNSLPFQKPGHKETMLELSVLPKKTIQLRRAWLESRLLHVEGIN